MEITTIVNENNIFSISELEYIRQIIENMDKYNQIEILKIIYQKKSKCINENKYGIHINMTELSNDIIEKLNEYIKYVNIQEIEINNIEKEKENYINTFFT
tara:strand:+ start:1032 stop:1334 length:303 start_codon:yes stop_codon:yes gene_type:complete